MTSMELATREAALLRLRKIAADIVANSTAPEAVGFDVDAWLEAWIQLPQPALGDKKPVDLLGTELGIDAVAKILGTMESGAYV